MAAENSAVRPATFASLGVPAPLVAVLDDDGITTPFPIQTATLPDALAGRDILGRAQTGSGKSTGFAVALVAGLAADAPRRGGRPRDPGAGADGLGQDAGLRAAPGRAARRGPDRARAAARAG